MKIEQRLDAFFAKRRFEYFGFIGCAIIAITCTITAIGFTGLAGEPYSLLNHFISELGMTNESQLARVFNIGLIVGAPILGIFIIGTRGVIPSRVGGLARVLGVVTAAGRALVGVFPADLGGEGGLMGHGLSAITFFFGGCVTVGIFSLAIIFRRSNEPAPPPGPVGCPAGPEIQGLLRHRAGQAPPRRREPDQAPVHPAGLLGIPHEGGI